MRVTAGELLKAWRLKIDLTQEQLASTAGVTRSYISNYESDLASPSVRTLLRLISAIEESYGSFGREEHDRLARFFLGPSVEGTLLVTKKAIPLGGRGR